MRPAELPGALRRLRKAVKAWRTPVVTEISRCRDPFHVLASCLLSLRTRDEITEAASERLFDVCRNLMDHHQGEVPDTLESLLKLKGVGRKTANLTLILGHGRKGICVDTHVHRISNRWGYVKTRAADETEMALRKKLPERYWMEYNDLLVTFGQNLCKPISPLCSQCCVVECCRRVGVKHHR